MTARGSLRFLRSRQSHGVRRSATPGQNSARLLPFLPTLLLVLVLACCVAWGTFVGFARLAGFDVSLWRPNFGSLPPSNLFDVTRAAATAVGVLAGVFAVVYAYRRQRVSEADSRREDGEQLSQRYQDAAGQLGHERAAVRLAGVYAMSRLADDWPDQRQQCVDVLCAYIRLPVAEQQGSEEKVVRRTILDEIASPTAVDKPPRQSWSALRLDLSNSRIDDFHARNSKFENLSLEGARLNGNVSFSETVLSGLLNIGSARIRGDVYISAVGLQGRLGHISLLSARVLKGGSLTIRGPHRLSNGHEFASSDLNGVIVDGGGAVSVTLSAGAKGTAFRLREMEVFGDLEIYGSGENYANDLNIITNGLETLESGAVTV